MIVKLENILKELNIELAYQEYDGDAEEYLIFDIYDLRENDFADDINLSLTNYITINYWHKLKDNGFYFIAMKTLNKTDSFYGKNFTFKIDCMEE